jgi:TolB-like protein
VVIAAAAGIWWAQPGTSPAVVGQPDRPLIVVRALRNLSPDPAQAYFADGLTEEIRGQLSQVSALRLLSQNAVQRA